MRRSQLFTKTRKQAPADEVSKNAQLLIRAGFIHKEMAGVYAYLPLGKRVLDNIVQIIREEMNAIGGNEVNLTALQRREPWEASGRWSDEVMDVWFRTKLANGTELGLGATHEEPLTDLMKQFISSYKDLPAYPYQFQTKFRNELRAKSGIMRGREFLMKDLYSFSVNREEHDVFYDRVSDAYDRIWQRLGIGNVTYKTFASGGSFSKYSHEFQTLSDVGEDIIYVHEARKIAINEEVYNDEVLADLGVSRDELIERKAVEVGNIFTLGTKFSDALNLSFVDEQGSTQRVFMGSYGIGPSRLMGLLAEHFSDDRGLVWPENIAPMRVYLVRIGTSDQVVQKADKMYEFLQSKGISVLYDDRNARPGDKFADADLIGLPHRVVVSERLLEQEKIEYTHRASGESLLLTEDALLDKLV
ncbi:prolyl-tRNA synthetase [Candidatus Saccharibacteria bacterium]|nr:MAG: prolyl-tRNA synthetase [Candidatus Saccharibacteria bacterium]